MCDKSTYCATQLTYIIRQAPFAVAQLADEDVSIDFRQVTTPADRVAVIATEALTTNERWTPIAPGTLLGFDQGAVCLMDPQPMDAAPDASEVRASTTPGSTGTAHGDAGAQ